MIVRILKRLDIEVSKYNQEALIEGFATLKKATVKILGQTALLEANIDLKLNATNDVDAYIDGVHWIRKKFDELLSYENKHLDPHSNEVWMPKETKYKQIFYGHNVDGFVAEPEYVLLSKALKAFPKNKMLILEYLSKKPSKKFLALAKKYRLDLKGFISE